MLWLLFAIVVPITLGIITFWVGMNDKTHH